MKHTPRKVSRRMRQKLYLRHYWRYGAFDELAKLYASNMFRSIASSLFAVFIPIYLLKTGFSFTQVCLYFAGYFLVRIFGDALSCLVTAKIGPKHAWILSHGFNVIGLTALLFLQAHPKIIFVSLVFNAFGTSFRFIPMYVNFSKIKDDRHSGKEQGYFAVLENVGGAIGPILGGVVAGLYGAHYTIVLSVVIYGISIVVLLTSKENVRTSQKLKIRKMKLKGFWRDAISYSARGIDTTVQANVWPMFLMLFIVSGDTYQLVGLISTIALLVSVFVSYFAGHLSDKYNSRKILRLSVVAEAIIFGLRSILSTFQGATALISAQSVSWNILNITYNKGLLSQADDHPGYRIVYFTLLEIIGEFFKMTIWLILAGLSLLLSTKLSIQVMFILTGVVILMINLERFSLFDKTR